MQHSNNQNLTRVKFVVDIVWVLSRSEVAYCSIRNYCDRRTSFGVVCNGFIN